MVRGSVKRLCLAVALFGLLAGCAAPTGGGSPFGGVYGGISGGVGSNGH